MSTKAFGTWPSPVTSEVVVAAANMPTAIAVDGDDVWWSETRPGEGGRTAVLRRRADGSVDEVLAAPWNARTAVHEYGGGAWWVRGGVLWFADWATQRLHRLADDGVAVALTPEPPVSRGLRYADGDVSPDGSAVLCVQEAHGADGVVENTIVRLDAAAPSSPQVVVDGPDFVSSPRWRPDGEAFCWLEWDHPDMPWDATRLVVDAGGQRTLVAGGDRPESVVQPTWAPDGSLWFSADRTGFWSLYRWSHETGTETMVDIGRDIGFPAWVFGETRFAFLDDGSVAFVYVEDGLDRLAVRLTDGTIAPLDTPFTVIQGLTANGSMLRCIAASPTTEPHVVEVDVDGATAGDPVVIVAPRDLPVGEEWFSTPEPVEFPTAGGATAHALLYRPRNPDVTGSRRRSPAAARRDPRRADVGGAGDAQARLPVLDITWLRRRRRQPPWVDGVRAGVPGAAARASGASSTSRTAPRSAATSSSEATSTRNGCASGAVPPAGSRRCRRWPTRTCSPPGRATTASPISLRWPPTHTSSRAVTSTG